MRIDPRAATGPEMYRFLIGAIVPRPIAWVSTRGTDGTSNVAPFSYFTALSSEPPLLGFAVNVRPGDPKDTLRNVRDTGEFVVNIVTEPLLDAMVTTAGTFPAATSEFAAAGLDEAPSEQVRAPRVAAAPVHLECRLHREIELGNSVFIVGEVVAAHASDDVVTEGRLDPAKLPVVGRLGGDFYSLQRDVVRMGRPRVDRAAGEASR